MSLLAKGLVAVVALIHFYIAWFEIFAWTSRGPSVFSSFPADLFEPTKSMAANQGLYNAFLAAGLVWSFLIKDEKWQRNIATCFLVFVAIAGIFGAITVSQRTLYVQLLPAVLGLIAIQLSPKSEI